MSRCSILAVAVLANVFKCTIQLNGVSGFTSFQLQPKTIFPCYHSSNSLHQYYPISSVRLFAEKPTIQFCSEFQEKDTDNNPKDPTTWHDDLSPEVFTHYFARNEFSLESIRELLLANEIKSLLDIPTSRGLAFLNSIKRDEVIDLEIITAAVNTLRRSRNTPERLLGGEVVYDSSCISENVFQVYSGKAVSVQPLEMAPPNNKCRNTEFSLVLGPSGTGKTLFSLRRLPQLACSNNLKECFLVHLRAGIAAELMASKTISFPEAVAEIALDAIKRKLGRKDDVDSNVPVDLYLHVTIDEAGLESTRTCFGSAVEILRIVDELKGIKYRFTKGVHVTVVGTGLEEITASVVSEVETTKFRMKPWTETQFDALVDAYNHPRPSFLRDVVRRFAILRDLITNARCAYYIVTSTTTTRFLRDVLVRDFVKVLVSAVANEYISTNGLKYLLTVERKWEVCRSIWRQLDKATLQRGVAFLTNFDDLEDESSRNAAKLLIEVNVELRNTIPLFVDKTCPYSLSVSPALAIVMARLFNARADLSWDWESFETVAMLGELKHLVANSEVIPRNAEQPIIELRGPLPMSQWVVPVVNRYTVVLNGKLASYADIIAPYRLIQAKFSDGGASSKVTLDLGKELDKMGLLEAGKNRCLLQQALTSRFYFMWETLESVPLPVARSSSFEKRPPDEVRPECYPYNTLSTPESVEEPVVMSFDATTMKFCFSEEDVDRLYSSNDERKALLAAVKAMNEAGPFVDFQELRPVTAVFVTNGGSFAVLKSDFAKAFSVKKEDVDLHGRLTKSIPEVDDIIKHVRKNVQLRFQFH